MPRSPTPFLLGLLSLGVIATLAVSRGPAESASDGRPPGSAAGSSTGVAGGGRLPGGEGRDPRTDRSPGAVGPAEVASGDFCHDVGYLCAALEEQRQVTLRRWTGHEGPVVVHVPAPEGLDPATASALQRAAATGIRAWNEQPFPVLVDLRGDRDPHFAVEWTTSLGGRRVGLARTSWSADTGLVVRSILLATRDPFDAGAPADPRRLRLTAAHEMGHALGLPHSDRERDVMYPVNTATSMSARDYRSVEILYATPDGTTIVRE